MFHLRRRSTKSHASSIATVILLGLFLPPAIGADNPAVRSGSDERANAAGQSEPKLEKIQRTTAEWRKRLNRKQFSVMRQHGTERAFSGKYWDHKGDGIYCCAGCDLPLFDSQTKFESGTGWPSFFAPLEEHVQTQPDVSRLPPRTEVHCRRCESHLGHVFSDGPAPTGLRYCINSVCLKFQDREKPRDTDARSSSSTGTEAPEHSN